MRTTAFFLLPLLLSCAAAQAGVYRWVDEQGRVHFGDRPPSRQSSQELQVQPAPPNPPSAPPAVDRREQERRLLRAWELERREEQAAQRKAAQEQARRLRNCGIARDRLERYRSAGALFEYDAQGQRRVLGEAERKAAEQEAAAAVGQWCD